MANVKVKMESWKDVPAERKRAFLSMTLYDGMMRDYVRKTAPLVFTAYLTGGHKGRKVGWACYNTERQHAMFYVKRAYRGRGVAKALMDAALKVANEKGLKIVVFPHDDRSDSFLLPIVEANEKVLEGSTYELEREFSYGAHYSSSLDRPRKPWKR